MTAVARLTQETMFIKDYYKGKGGKGNKGDNKENDKILENQIIPMLD